MDLRQDAPRGRRPAHAASRSALHPQERAAEPASWDEALGAVAAKLKSRKPDAHRRHRRRSRGRRGDVRAQGPVRAPGIAELRLPAGRQQARPEARARQLRVQFRHRGHRSGGRHSAGRHQSPARGGGAQCAHPQALAPGRADGRRHRRKSGSGLPLRVSRWRAADAERAGGRQGSLRRRSKRRQAADGDRRRRCGCSCRRRRQCLSPRPRSRLRDGRQRRSAGTRSTCCSTAASRVAGLDLGFVPKNSVLDIESFLAAAGTGSIDLLYLLGADEIDLSRLGSAFVVYQGSHGDAAAASCRRHLPGAAYTEKSATYVNTEGRAQLTARAAFPPGDAKEDWTIVRALSPLTGHTLPYDNLLALRAAMYKTAPQLMRLDQPEKAPQDAICRAPARGWRREGRAFPVEHHRFLSHQSDCARFGRDGRDERIEESSRKARRLGCGGIGGQDVRSDTER